MRRKSQTSACRLSTSLTTKNAGARRPGLQLAQRTRAAQQTAEAEAPHAAQPAQAPEGRVVVKPMEGAKPKDVNIPDVEKIKGISKVIPLPFGVAVLADTVEATRKGLKALK